MLFYVLAGALVLVVFGGIAWMIAVKVRESRRPGGDVESAGD